MQNKLRTIFILGLSAAALCASAQWSQYHGNAQRTGFTNTVSASSLSLSWATDLGGPVVSSPVVGPDGTIYVGPVQEELLRPRTVVTAIAPDGNVKWRFYTKFVENDSPTFSTPAVSPDGVIYFGSTDGAFYALNPNGTLKWKHQGIQPVIQSPVIAPDGTIYVGIDGNLCSFSPTGILNWQRHYSDLKLSGGPTLALDGTIFQVGGDAAVGSSMLAVNPNGTLKWQTFLNLYFWPLAPPTVGPSGTIYTVDQGIHALNPNGTIKWYSEPSYGINGFGSIAVDMADNLYYTGYVYAWKLNSNGFQVWEYTHTGANNFLGHSISGILVDGAGKLLMGLGDGKRSAIEYEKQILMLSNAGSRVAGFTLPEIAGTSSPAMMDDGAILIGSLDNKLYAFNMPPEQQQSPQSMAVEAGIYESGTLADLYNVDNQNVTIKRSDTSRQAYQATLAIEGTSYVSNPAMLKLQLAAKSVTTGSVRVRVEMYNWTTAAYELMSDLAVPTVGMTANVYANGPALRFIQPGTKKMRARLVFSSDRIGFSGFAWKALIDQAVWKTIR
jgi:outer membrane protein assembly factor BamB